MSSDSSAAMKEAAPQSAVVVAPSKQCEWCGKQARSRCSDCRLVVFCSKACQKKAWPRHKYVCVRVKPWVVDPNVSPMYGVGDPAWDAAHRKLDSARIKHLREIGEVDDPDEHPDYLQLLPLPELKRVIEYMDVKSVCRMDSVVNNVYALLAWYKALKGTYSRALSEWPHHSIEDKFAGLKWSIQRRVELREIKYWKVSMKGVDVRDSAEKFKCLCMKKRFSDIACLLVESGSIDANLTLKAAVGVPWTLLHFASYFGRVEVVTTLLERGADINSAMNDGRTPLFIAS